ncbi:hypothetical protein DND66_24055 [Escherichia coli]|nr:hypothetical protein [Escherichia coli]
MNVRDDRNAGSALAPAVCFAYSPDRKGIHSTACSGDREEIPSASELLTDCLNFRTNFFIFKELTEIKSSFLFECIAKSNP